MEDLKKIQEFFSKPLEESTFKVGDKVTYLGHPGVITAVRKTPSGDTTYSVAYDKGFGRTKVSDIYNKGGEIKLAEANGFTSGKQMLNIKFKNYPKAISKVNQLIDMIGESNFTMEMAEWIWDFFNNAHFERPVNEAKSEDKVDTITMDIPLFLRMLEYSREDASQDMDLHDVTEKANLLGKERGILQMDDYDEIVGAAKEIDEAELSEAYVPSNIKEFAKRKGVSSLVNKVAGWAEKVGKGIRGGTAIGKNYSTLILDMDYQTADIYINTEDGTIELYGEPVENFNEFQRAYNKKDLIERVINRLKNDPRRIKR